MVARVHTVAFHGIDVLDIDVQVQFSSGLVAFTIVGLPDKTIAESRERIRGALYTLGLSLPAKRITINLAPADLLKEGSHFDLPIAVGILTMMGMLPQEQVARYSILGELGLDGSTVSVEGVLPAAINAVAHQRGLACPYSNGEEAVWAGGDLDIIAAPSLLSLINHFKGVQKLPSPSVSVSSSPSTGPSLHLIKGQETAKRALEIVASGGHHLMMIGPPGAGKSLLASRLPDLLPVLTPHQSIEVSIIHSMTGLLESKGLLRRRPFRDPHHSASLVALVGGGRRAKPGEISLAHHGVLFLDELPEFQRQTLESLRQPIETGTVTVARANHHFQYPARFQLVTAMNPCRCGYMTEQGLACKRAPECGVEYQSKISGPLIDRIDCHVSLQMVSSSELIETTPQSEQTATIARRVSESRAIQIERYQRYIPDAQTSGMTNAAIDSSLLEKVAVPDVAGKNLLARAIDLHHLSARGYHRVLRVARTLADMERHDAIHKRHIAEALTYRRLPPRVISHV